jgi:hypothetical protein
LVERIDNLRNENEQLKAEIARLSRKGPTSKLTADAPTPASIGPAPDYPKETPTVIADMPKADGWAHLKASVQGFGKESLQDAHAVLTSGSSAVLIVCDGAGSKKCSKAGADFASRFLEERFKEIFAAGSMLKADEWTAFSKELLFTPARPAIRFRISAQLASSHLLMTIFVPALMWAMDVRVTWIPRVSGAA